MSTTHTAVLIVVVLALALLGYLFLVPGGGGLGQSAQVEGDGTMTLGTPSASLDELAGAFQAEIEREKAVATDSGDVDAALTVDNDIITTLTNSTNDSNF